MMAVQRSTRPRATHWVGLELLERRVLLSAAPTGSHIIDVDLRDHLMQAYHFGAVSFAPSSTFYTPFATHDDNVVSIRWAGKDVTARADQWLIHFDEDLVSDQALIASLLGAGIGNVKLTYTNTAGYTILDAPLEDVSLLGKWWANMSASRGVSSAGAMAGVIEVQPNFVYQAADLFPDDTSFDQLFGLHNTGQSSGMLDADIDAPDAWELTTGSSDIVVAVIDTGIDHTHPDLTDNMWNNPGEIPDNGIDDDGNGFVDDFFGFDFANDDPDPLDGNGHGTHVAGTIGAQGDNAKGVVGVNWDVQLMALKFLGDNGYGTTANAIDAIEYATMMKTQFGINIVASNNSWGGGGADSALRRAIEDAGDASILFVAAAGNGGNDGRGDDTDAQGHFPSAFDLDNIIAVAATDRSDQRATFSNFGATTVDLAAPGVSILSTLPGNNFGQLSGTSMATPHVAGAAALVKALRPEASAMEIKSAILSSAERIPAMAGVSVSGGRLNVFGALQAISIKGPRVLDIDLSSAVPPVDQITITFTIDIAAESVVPGNFQLTGNGPDDQFDTPDDKVFILEPDNFSQPRGNQVVMQLNQLLEAEAYRLIVRGTGTNPIRNDAHETLNDGVDHVQEFVILAPEGPFELNDSIADAMETNIVGTGQTTLSARMGDGFFGNRDVDLFRVQVITGATINADIDAEQLGTGLDPILRLFAVNGQQLAFNDDTNGLDSSIEVRNLPPGTYFIGVSGFSNVSYDATLSNSGTPGSIGDYDLTIQVVDPNSNPNPIESIEVVLTGAEMMLGVNKDGSLVASETTDIGARFKGQDFLTPGVPQASITLAAGGFLFQNNSPANDAPAIPMSVSETTVGARLSAQGVASAGGVKITRDIAFDEDGRVVTIDVTLSNETNTPVPRVAWLENLDPDQGFDLLDGTFDTNNDVLFEGRYAEATVFADAFPDGLTIAIASDDPRAVASTQGFNVDDPFDVIDFPQDNQGVFFDTAINLAFDVGTLNPGAETTLTYLLIFDSSQDAARAFFEERIQPGSDEREPNDTLMTASVVDLTVDALSAQATAMVSAVIGDGEQVELDVDLYALSAEQGQVLTIDVDAAQIGSSLDAGLRLFDESGIELAINDDFDGRDAKIQHVIDATGTFVVGVSGFDNFDYDPDNAGSGVAASTGEYHLAITRVTPEQPTGAIAGVVFHDADKNQQRGDDELGLPGVTVFLDLNGNGALDDMATVSIDSADVPRAIGDLATFTSELEIGGETGYLIDLDVTLDISHTFVGDLDVALISPTGTRVSLVANVGDSGDDFTNTTYDDEAATSIVDAAPPFDGVFQPVGALSDFDGRTPNGVWTLQVTDEAFGDQGVLNSWSVTMAVEEPSAVTAADDPTTEPDEAGTYWFTRLATRQFIVREQTRDGFILTDPIDNARVIDIVDDDIVENVNFGNAGPVLTIDDATVDEGDQGVVQAVFIVTLAQAVDEPVTVEFTTTLGTADDGDFQSEVGTLTFNPQQLTETIIIDAFGDADVEDDESFAVELSNASGAIIGDGVGKGTIVNDDVLPRQIVTVTQTHVTADPGQPFSVDARYSTSDENASLPGLGLRMHFDSSVMTFDGLSMVLPTGYSQMQLIDDTPDFDVNPNTDMFLLVLWVDLANNWPGTALPVDLFTADFTFDVDTSQGAVSPINFTTASTAPTHVFDGDPINAFVGLGPNLDVDGNGQARFLSDGLTILRFLAGFRSQALINATVDPNGLRADADDIEAALGAARDLFLDVDGNGVAQALTDGLMILRFLAGFQGDAITAGTVDLTGTRNTPELITEFLSGFLPGAAPAMTAAASVAPTGGINYAAVWDRLSRSRTTDDGRNVGSAFDQLMLCASS
jgi:subtilisin family serine protease/subtilisin-like proprotein convertase family protein